MQFNSYIFLFLFFPICLAGYYILTGKKKGMAAKLWLTAFSFWFYAYFSLPYLAVLLVSIGINYAVYRAMLACRSGADGKVLLAQAAGKEAAFRENTGGKRKENLLLVAGIASNLAILFYFKYYNFFIENINAVFHTDFLIRDILLPLGISFFTFQQIGFLTDTWRGETPEYSLLDYTLFVSFFPKIIQGPIVTHEELMPQFEGIGRKQPDWGKITGGVYLFVLGMAKKVLLADTFGAAVDWGFSNAAGMNSVEAVLTAVFYALQLYLDFSGYCDMARGLAYMLGIQLPINFDSPHKASNLIDFWKRWHMTLNRFLLKYVYIPLGGNRKGIVRMYTNLLLVFLISGIWHGAGWTFIIWGLMHGVLYVITRWYQLGRKKRADHARNYGTTASAAAEKKQEENEGVETVKKSGLTAVWNRISHAGAVTLTFLYVCAAWVFFRAESVGQALSVFKSMFTGGFALPSAGCYDAFNLDEFWYVFKILHIDRLPGSNLYLMVGFLVITLIMVFFTSNTNERFEKFEPRVGNMFAAVILFVWCVVSFSGVGTFLYVNF